MFVCNNFCLIGIVYQDSKITYIGKNKKVVNIVLSVKDHYNKGKTNYIPLTSYNDTADKCELLGKNGNILAVSGEIISKEYFNQITGKIETKIYFVVSDIMPIYRTTRKKIEDKDFSSLIKEYELD